MAVLNTTHPLVALPMLRRRNVSLPLMSQMLLNGPYIAGLIAGLGGSAPTPFSLGISNVPGPTETLYFNGAKLDALFPLSLLLHGNALNITCLSYAGTLNFGFTGARDTLPHLERLALYMGDSLEDLTETLFGTELIEAHGIAMTSGYI